MTDYSSHRANLTSNQQPGV